MSKNSGTKSCDCSSESYMTSDKRTCICNNIFNIIKYAILPARHVNFLALTVLAVH